MRPFQNKEFGKTEFFMTGVAVCVFGTMMGEKMPLARLFLYFSGALTSIIYFAAVCSNDKDGDSDILDDDDEEENDEDNDDNEDNDKEEEKEDDESCYDDMPPLVPANELVTPKQLDMPSLSEFEDIEDMDMPELEKVNSPSNSPRVRRLRRSLRARTSSEKKTN